MNAYATQTFITALTALIDERVSVVSTPVERPTTYMTTKQAAVYLACPVSRVYDLVSSGDLVPYRDGRRLKFTMAQLDQYLEGACK